LYVAVITLPLSALSVKIYSIHVRLVLTHFGTYTWTLRDDRGAVSLFGIVSSLG